MAADKAEDMDQSASAKIEVTGIPAFRDNRVWCVSREREAVIVDPGDAAPVFDHLEKTGLDPVALLVTHHHADHVGGIAELCQRYPGIPVFGPAVESITGVSRPLAGGEQFSLLAARWRVMAVPGHTRGHLAYSLDAGPDEATATRPPPQLFSGDVLFGLGCGRLFEGTAKQMADSLASIAALPDDTRVYCAHEYTALGVPFARLVMAGDETLRRRIEVVMRGDDAGESTLPLRLGEEKATNPFLRCRDPQVIAAAARHSGLAEAALAGDPVAVFAILREWRNQF